MLLNVRMRARICKIYCIVLFLGVGAFLHAEQRPYLCELGVQAGCGYYVGDATPHIFMNVRETYGAHFRYKFTSRWALQVKGSAHHINGANYTIRGEKLDSEWNNQVINVDVMAEFNFFRLGTRNKYDRRIRPYTPYIFIGVGAALYGVDETNKSVFNNVACYIPFGVGFKWKFADWCGLNLAWQHNIYMADNLESRPELDNKHQLNGWNWMNCDLAGQLTLGLVFEFGKAPRDCRICNY